MEHIQQQLLDCQQIIQNLTQENAALKQQIHSKDALMDNLQLLLMCQEPSEESSSRKKRLHVQMGNDFRADDVAFDDAISRVVGVSMKDTCSPVVIQTPAMTCPFGISTWNDTKQRPKHSVQLAFHPMVAGPSSSFLTEMTKLQDRLSRRWATAPRVFVPFLRSYAGGDAMIRVALSGSGESLAYNCDKQRIGIEQCVYSGATVSAIIRCNGVWFTDDKFGMSWSLLQVRLVRDLNEYAFTDEASQV